MSIDDFYHIEERDMNERGNPGTHDMNLLQHVFQELYASGKTRVPRFDKATQSRSYQSITEKPKLIILEGWCIGFTSLESALLPDDKIIRDVNQELNIHYDHVWKNLHFDIFVIMYPCSLEWILEWRKEQEIDTKKIHGGGMSMIQVERLVKRCIITYKYWTSQKILNFLFDQQKNGNIDSILVFEQDQSRRFVSTISPIPETFTFPWESGVS